MTSTLSMLMGLPIPYNNLGIMIPDLILKGNDNYEYSFLENLANGFYLDLK